MATPRVQTNIDVAASIVAGAAFLVLAVLAASRERRDALARSLALLSVDMVSYCASHALGVASSQPVWHWISNATASFAPPLFYQLVITFVGRRKDLRVPIIVAYAYGCLLACLGVWGGARWAIAMLVGLVVVAVHGIIIVLRHVRGAPLEEVARARLLFAAVLVAATANATSLVGIAGASWSPRLGAEGLAVTAVLLAAAALRIRVFERLSLLTLMNAVAIALAVALAEVAAFQFIGDRGALVVIVTVIAALGTLLSVRFVVADHAKARERTLAYATLGRMAAQMAHDIKNPIAAVSGAAQFLAEERAAGRSIDTQQEFLDVLVAQCKRIARIVDQYQRIGGGAPVLAPTDLNDAVREAVRFLGQERVDAALGDTLMPCNADRDLLVIALENLLRNAHEAAPGGIIHVTTGAAGEHGWMFVSVRDEGPGMDPRTREHALEGLFTTKAHGSGLGLSFVRRVVDAHGGRFVLDTHEGRGTTVRIELRA